MVNTIISTKKRNIQFILLMLLIFITPFISAAPPVNPTTQVSDNTLELETPPLAFIKQGQDHRFHVHVINDTSTKTNKTTSCFIHVYNSTGFDIDTGSQFMEFESYNGIDFAKTINGNNFTNIGDYAFVIQCNSSIEVGFVSGQLQVTPNGSSPSLDNFLFEPFLLLIITIIFLVAAITFNNKRWLIKSSLYLMTSLFLVLTINSSSGYITNLRGQSMLNTAFILLVSLVSLLFIVLLVYYLKSLANALKQVRSEKKEDLL